ncbi:MAG: tetratricopeptide repeat protein [bacterium]|nr:tetratricopeptide repeat protein [bacterium]
MLKDNLREKILNFSFWGWFNKNRLVIILLIALVFAAYFNSLDNSFVSDDIAAIPQNENLNNFSYVSSNPQAFVRNLFYYSTNKVWGLNPAPYRLIGILFHLGTVLTSYLLIWILLDPITALISACLFAVHPILIEGVAWISGGLYAQYSFFIILTLLFYVFSIKGKKFYLLSLASLVMALLSSEKAVVFPFVLLAFFIFFKDTFKDWKKLITPIVISSAWALFYLLAIPKRIAALQIQSPQPAEILDPFLQIPIAIGSYLKLIFWPKDLTLYHSEMVFSQTQYLTCLFVLILLLTIIFISLKKKSQVFFWLSFFLISLLPVLTPFGISWIVAERYVYLGTLGIVVAFAILLKKLAEKEKLKTAIFIFSSLIVIFLLIRTIVRNNDWQNQDSLWLAAAKTSPSSSQNHNNLGDLYGRKGDLEKAVQEFKLAIELNPRYADAFHNLANTYQLMGKEELAVENYKKAVEFNPYLWQSYQNLALIYFQQKDLVQASQYLEKAIEVNPENASLYFNLGVVYAENNEKEKANMEFQKAFDLDPKLKQSLLTQ